MNMAKTKVLHISKYFYPYYGGIEDVVYTLVQAFHGDYEQHVLCFSDTRHTTCDTMEDIPVTRVGTWGKLASQPISPSYGRELHRLLQHFRPDVIHLHLPNPWVCYFLLKEDMSHTRLIVHWHADIIGRRLLYRMIRSIEKAVLDCADTIIVTSQNYQDASLPLRHYANKIQIVPNVLNVQKLQFTDAEEEQAVALRRHYHAERLVFFVGRHVEYKGIKYLIDAVPYLPEHTKVIIGGEGILTDELKRQAEPYADRVIFTGRLSDEQLRIHFRAADVFAFPSIDRREAFGLAMAEALYCGLPVVSFHIDGSGTDWVNRNGETGVVVPKLDARMFGEAIKRLLINDNLRHTYSLNAQRWVREQFLPDKVNLLHDIYAGKALPLPEEDEAPITTKKPLNISIVLYRQEVEPLKKLVAELLKVACLRKIYLIDNSPMKSPELEHLDHRVKYVFNNGNNLGYGCGHNIAIRESVYFSTPFHLVMNADIELQAETIDYLCRFMQHNPTVGSVMPRVVYPDGRLQYLCRLLPTPLDVFGRRFLPDWLFAHRNRYYELRRSGYDKVMNVPYLSGCFMFMRTEAVLKARLFDERYFMYPEDIDLTRTIHRDYLTLYVPDVTIVHNHEQGSYKSWHLLWVHIVNMCRYFNKYGWFYDPERRLMNRLTLSQFS